MQVNVVSIQQTSWITLLTKHSIYISIWTVSDTFDAPIVCWHLLYTEHIVCFFLVLLYTPLTKIEVYMLKFGDRDA